MTSDGAAGFGVINNESTHSILDNDSKQRDVDYLLSPSHAQFQAARIIGGLHSGQILNDKELAALAKIEAENLPPQVVGLRQLVVVLKNTRLCNLRCHYCRSWAEGPGQVMRFDVLARVIREVLSAEGPRLVEFVWHGGEVTQLSPAYFNKMIWLQQRYARRGTTVKNLLQTNAVALSEEWVTFLRAHRIDIGVSIDGPPRIHDSRRVDRDGEGTSSRIAASLRRLAEHKLTFGALVVVDRDLAAVPPAELLDYFCDIGLRSANLLNVLPENDCEGGEYLSATEFTDYLVRLHREWDSGYRERIALQPFLNLEAGVRADRPAASCLWSGDCMGRFITVEPNGDVAPCDKYVGAQGAILGNLARDRLGAVLASPALRVFSDAAADAKRAMEQCRWHGVCQGGCPHDKYISELRGLEHDSGCCGSAPLLEAMQSAMQSRMADAAS
jgi:uncharacterized protein